MKLKKTLISITALICLVAIAIISLTYRNFQVIYAIEKPSDFHQEKYFIMYKGKKYLTDKIYVYKHNVIREYLFAAGEDLGTIRFDFFDNRYHVVDGYRILSFDEESDNIIYNGKTLKIDYQVNDTIVSELNENEIFIFIKK